MTSISKLSSFEIVKRRNSLDNKPPHYAIATVIEAVVDASSSMSSMGDTPPEQIHKLIVDQNKIAMETGNKIYFSLTTFASKSNVLIDNVDLSDPNYTPPTYHEIKTMMTPNGMTRFYDTLIERIAEQKKNAKNILHSLPYNIRSLKPQINRVLYTLTDGQDNQSKLSISHLRNCLNTNKKISGFTAVFLAANIGNAEVVGANMGFNADTSLTIGNDAHFAGIGMNHANSLLRAVSGGSAPPAFSISARTSSQPIYNGAAYLASGLSSNNSQDIDDDLNALLPLPIPQLVRQTNASFTPDNHHYNLRSHAQSPFPF